MNAQYLSLTELGRLYGVTSHKVGRILKEEGLRTDAGKPSSRAHKEKYVDQRGSTNPATYFYVWDKEKTVKVLNEYLKMPEPEPASVPESIEEPVPEAAPADPTPEPAEEPCNA